MDLEPIQNKIYEIRGYRVMIDRDLAEIYGVETRILNQSAKRNIKRFPQDFMFQLTDNEFEKWKSQIVITKSVNMGLRRKPYAFTELGVAMLSSVLNSETAIGVNISVMRAFVAVRSLILNPPGNEEKQLQSEVRALKEYVEDVFTDQNDINEDTRMQLELINQALAELQTQRQTPNSPRRRIGYRTSDEDEFI